MGEESCFVQCENEAAPFDDRRKLLGSIRNAAPAIASHRSRDRACPSPVGRGVGVRVRCHQIHAAASRSATPPTMPTEQPVVRHHVRPVIHSLRTTHQERPTNRNEQPSGGCGRPAHNRSVRLAYADSRHWPCPPGGHAVVVLAALSQTHDAQTIAAIARLSSHLSRNRQALLVITTYRRIPQQPSHAEAGQQIHRPGLRVDGFVADHLEQHLVLRQKRHRKMP